MPRRTIRLSVDADERLQSAVKLRGYANPSAFLRAAMDHELKGREETMLGAEERLATSMDQISREISRLGRAQQALFALVDSEPTGVISPAKALPMRMIRGQSDSMQVKNRSTSQSGSKVGKRPTMSGFGN